jgi:hypothetical protein
LSAACIHTHVRPGEQPIKKARLGCFEAGPWEECFPDAPQRTQFTLTRPDSIDEVLELRAGLVGRIAS